MEIPKYLQYVTYCPPYLLKPLRRQATLSDYKVCSTFPICVFSNTISLNKSRAVIFQADNNALLLFHLIFGQPDVKFGIGQALFNFRSSGIIQRPKKLRHGARR